jgi:hypothetical protein
MFANSKQAISAASFQILTYPVKTYPNEKMCCIKKWAKT